MTQTYSAAPDAAEFLTIKPYAHQQEAYIRAIGKLLSGDGFALFMEVGTGKTLSAIACIGALEQLRGLRRVLIVCPGAVYKSWLDDLARLKTSHVAVALNKSSKHKRDALAIKYDKLEIAIVNYESVRMIEDSLTAWKPDMIVCDESQKIKTHNSQQSRALHRLGDRTPYRLILTGTPIGNSPLDVWSQYRFAEPKLFGKNFYSFQTRYAVVKSETTYGGQSYKKIIGYRHIEELKQIAYQNAYRVLKKDCLDLPEQTDVVRAVTLEDKAMKLYRSLSRTSVAQLESGEIASAAYLVTKLMRLSQLTGGFLPTDDGRMEHVSQAKLSALRDVAEDVLDNGKKLVIFAHFKAEISLITAQMKGMTCPDAVVVLDGDTQQELRADAIRRFQEDDKCRVFIGNAQCAGAGITLTAADTTVFYSLSYSYLEYEQARARIHRIGQKNVCTYVHLVAERTIDETVLDALRRKTDVAKEILENKKIEWLGGNEDDGICETVA